MAWRMRQCTCARANLPERRHCSCLDHSKAAASSNAPSSAPAASSGATERDSIATQGAAHGGDHAGKAVESDDEDDAFVPIEIEYVIDSLLQGLQDRDTVVRWSGAKGLGRVAARLPKHLANEVVEAVLGLFSSEDASLVNTWHGV